MTEPAIGDLAEWIAPSRTALVIVDMQVDFAAPDGAMGRAGVDLSAVPPAMEVARELTAVARMARAPVVFVGLQTADDTDSTVWRERGRRRRGESLSPLCRAGTPGAAFVGPQPGYGDLVIAKSRYSAFFGTGLHTALKARGTDTLVVCGLTTECCVDCTVRDAFQLDYHVFIATDACAAYDQRLHAAALDALDLNCAILLRSEQAAAAWRLSSGPG
jgi:nicotinamidase-related amidase